MSSSDRYVARTSVIRRDYLAAPAANYSGFSMCWPVRGQTVDRKATEARNASVFRRVLRCGAEGGTRTPTVLLPPAPQAGASANSATSARQVGGPQARLFTHDTATALAQAAR